MVPNGTQWNLVVYPYMMEGRSNIHSGWWNFRHIPSIFQAYLKFISNIYQATLTLIVFTHLNLGKKYINFDSLWSSLFVHGGNLCNLRNHVTEYQSLGVHVGNICNLRAYGGGCLTRFLFEHVQTLKLTCCLGLLAWMWYC